jgi:RNA polymerase sigma factor (TIGR02999 family)
MRDSKKVVFLRFSCFLRVQFEVLPPNDGSRRDHAHSKRLERRRRGRGCQINAACLPRASQSCVQLFGTALVHEAYLRLAGDAEMGWKDRAHFYGVAARLMRQILVDHARAHNAAKRGGLQIKLTLDEARDLPGGNVVELVALDGALQNFAQTYPRKSQVVELKFFGGLDAKEIAEVLQVSEKTVLRDWNFAKLWLCRELN